MNKTGMSPETAEKLRITKGIGKGTKLRRLRVQKGLSQSELSAKSGVSKKTIQRFEQNSDDINHTKLTTYCDLCIALECGIEDIIESKELLNRYKAVK